MEGSSKQASNLSKQTVRVVAVCARSCPEQSLLSAVVLRAFLTTLSDVFKEALELVSGGLLQLCLQECLHRPG